MIYKNSDEVKNNSYINKDFPALWEELLDLIPKFTNKWNPREANESDPLAVLLKLVAIYSDKLNYNIDKSILERFPQTLTELRSAKNVYEALGYNAPWYNAGSTILTFYYNQKLSENTKDGDKEFYIPKFTMVGDEDNNIIFTITEPVIYKFKDYETTQSKTKYIKALQGTIKSYQINGVSQITIDNLDQHNRLYFVEPNIAQNGIFIDTNPNFINSGVWEQVDNIYQTTSPTSYQFGVDPVSGACYIEFPDSIANNIGSGLYINYIVTNGVQGNVKARSINKYYLEQQYSYWKDGGLLVADQAFDKVDIPINNRIAVLNTTAVRNGQDPATIDEMYENYKRVKNTFDTLVTLLDYENFIYQYENDLGQNIVSNIRVSDRTNDLYNTVKVWQLNTDDTEVLKTLGVGPTGNPKGQDNYDQMNANSIRIYPLNPIPSSGVNTLDQLKNTFSNSSFLSGASANDSTYGDINATNPVTGSILEAIKEAKVVTTDTGAIPYEIIKIPYNIKGTVYLNHKVSQYAAKEVKENVQKALYDNLNARKLNFGEEISYERVLNIIQNADDRISYVALNPIDYLNPVYPSAPTGDMGGDTWKDIAKQRAILSGATPWADFQDTFTYNPTQSASPAGTPTPDLGLGIENYSIEDLGPTGYVSIYSNVSLTGTNCTHYRVLDNEDFGCYAPSYKEEITYSNYLYFRSQLNRNIDKDTPIQLGPNESILIYESRDDALNTNFYNTYKYKLKPGDCIKANFDLSISSLQEFKQYNNYLSTSKQISKLKRQEGPLGIVGQTIEFITNSKRLIAGSEGNYSLTGATLFTGEYFLYRNVGESAFTLFGEGTTIAPTGTSSVTIKQAAYDSWFDPKVDWEGEVTQGYEQEEITWADVSITNDTNINYLQNQIYMFGPDYVLKYSNEEIPLTGDNSWQGTGPSGNTFIISFATTSPTRIRSFATDSYGVSYYQGPTGAEESITQNWKYKILDTTNWSSILSGPTGAPSQLNIYKDDVLYYTIAKDTLITCDLPAVNSDENELRGNSSYSQHYIKEYQDEISTTTPQYKLAEKDKEVEEGDWESLPSLLPGDNWTGFIRLNYSLNKEEGFPLLYGKGSTGDYVTHIQQLVVEKGEDSYTIQPDELNNPVYVQSNVDITSLGGIKLDIYGKQLQDLLGSSGSLSFYGYKQAGSSVISGQSAYFTTIKEGQEWTVPGPTGYISIFGVYGNSDFDLGSITGLTGNQMYYFAAKAGFSLTPTGSDINVTNIRIAPTGSTYGVSNDSLNDLMGGDQIKQLDEDVLGNAYYNVTHKIKDTDLISREDASGKDGLFASNHPFNRYVLPMLQNLDELEIAPNSINS